MLIMDPIILCTSIGVCGGDAKELCELNHGDNT
jgi:hypothetical protein